MSNKIRVSVSRMDSDGNRIAEDIKNIEKDVDSLADAMRALGACWEGSAWNAFQNSVNDSITEMEDVLKFFDSYLKRTDEAAKKYVKCETENRNNLRCVRI